MSAALEQKKDVAQERRDNLAKARKAKAEWREFSRPLAPNEVRCILRLPGTPTEEQKARYVFGMQELIDGSVITLPDPKWER